MLQFSVPFCITFWPASPTPSYPILAKNFGANLGSQNCSKTGPKIDFSGFQFWNPFFPNRSLLLKGSSGGQRGGLQKRLIRLVGGVARTLGRPCGPPDFRKMLKIRENWNSEYKKWSIYKKDNSRFRIRKFRRMPENAWNCFKMLQNASKLLQNVLKCFKILQNTSKLL